MRISDILLLAVLAGPAACSGSGSSDAPDSGPDGSIDADTDSDTDADTDTGTGCDTDPCDELVFPPSNGPDGCARTLLTQIDGQAFDSTSRNVAISRDGNLAVFFVFHHEGSGVNGLPEDTNEEDDIYAVDLDSMEMEIITVNGDGEISNNSPGDGFSVSADGRFVAFETKATNLDPLDANICYDVYLRDRELETTEWISVSSQSGLDYGAWRPVVSADGRYVLFKSSYSDLVPDDNNGKTDLFLRDRELELTERINVDDDGGEVDGKLCYHVWQVSDDGRYVAFAHDSVLSPDDEDPEEWETDDKCDVYLHDRQIGTSLLISRAPDGFSGSYSEPIAMAPDGSWVLFTTGKSAAAHYYDAASSDWETGDILARIEGDSVEFDPILLDWTDFTAIPCAASADARYVVFADGVNLDLVEHMGMTGYYDIPIENGFVLDRDLGTVTLVTAAEDGTPGIIPYYVWGETTMNDFVTMSISGDGKRIVFSTIQYGIVDPYAHAIPCINTPHLVYLRDCP